MIKEGYKETEIGVIPENWVVNTLGDIITVTSGTSLSQKNVIKGLCPVYGGNGINAYHNKYEFREPQLVIGRVGAYCGCIHKTEPMAWITDNALYIREKKIDYYDDFMFYKLTQIDLNKYANQNAQPVISGGKIYPIIVAIPSLPEQKHIARILSTTDAHIEKLDKTIEDYKLLKKGMMKKLLTEGIGHTEFKETEIGKIPKEWDAITLGALGELQSSGVDKKIDPQEIPIKLINYMDVYKNTKIDNSIEFMRVTANERELENFTVDIGDVLFTPSSETPDDIGHSAVVTENIEGALFSYHLIKLSFKRQLDLVFKGYLFEESYVLKQFSFYCKGTTRYTLSPKDFAKVLVAIPNSLEEQKQISTILSNIDDRLKTYIDMREIFNQLKKGLMEKLLIGKIRTTDIKSLEA